jgi:hypothetical protein
MINNYEDILIKGMMLGGLAIMTVSLSGCGNKTVDKLNSAKNDVVSKVEQGKEMAEDGKGLVGGLKEAMKKGLTMKCVADSPDGHWVTYTNGKYSRTEGTTADGHEMVIVVNKEATYTWDKKTKKGQKLDKKCMEEFEKTFAGSAMNDTEGPAEEMVDDFTPEKLEAKEKSGELKCSPSTKADFTVPSDVQFTDQCKLMMEQMNKLKSQMPEAFSGMGK